MEPTSATGLMLLKEIVMQRAAQVRAMRSPGDLSLSANMMLDDAADAAKSVARSDGIGQLLDRKA